MKFIKSLFGIKSNKKVKYEANTLAETNGTPDNRSETATVAVASASLTKSENAKVAAPAPTSSKVEKAQTVAEKPAEPQAATVKAEKKVTETPTEKSENAPEVKTSPAKKTAPKKAENTAENAEKGAESKAKTAPKSTDTAAEAATKTTAKKPTAKTSAPSKSTDKKDAPASASEAKKSTSTKATTAAKSTDNTPALVEENAEEVTVTKSARTGKFEIKKSKDGRFVFNLYASNNVIVATSQVYSSSTSAMNGIKSVIANASTAPIEDQTLKVVTTVPFPKWEVYLDKGDQYRFRLCASNGSCVCHSQGYTSKANCKKGIESIIKSAADAEITKAYLEKKDK